MLSHLYALVMDPEKNPLSALPKIARFQYLLILSYIWSVAFTIWIGTSLLLGPTIIGHTAVLVAVFFTSTVFSRARKSAPDHREAMTNRTDGTVLYDDVWGGERDLSLRHG